MSNFIINQILYFIVGLFPKGSRRGIWNGIRIGKMLKRGLF